MQTRAVAGDARLLPGDDDAAAVRRRRGRATRAGSSPSYVSGRGAVPAVRIGDQPYGILPTTAFSRIRGSTRRRGAGRRAAGAARVPAAAARDACATSTADWAIMARQVARVGRRRRPRTPALLDVLGLHPASVEFHQRYAESLEHLFNHVDFFGLRRRAGRRDPASAGSTARPMSCSGGSATPATGGRPCSTKFFLGGQGLLRGPVVDDRPLSETEPVRVYTDDGRNYLRWLVDAAGSLDAAAAAGGVRRRPPPTALLYLLLRHALMLGYWDAGRELHRTADFDEAVLHALRREPRVRARRRPAPAAARAAGSRSTRPTAVTGGAGTVADHIAADPRRPRAETRGLREQLEALERLADAPTARLERAFAEHVDLLQPTGSTPGGWASCTTSSRRCAPAARARRRGGVHLGAYGWLEDVRPQPRELTPGASCPHDLEAVFARRPAPAADARPRERRLHPRAVAQPRGHRGGAAQRLSRERRRRTRPRRSRSTSRRSGCGWRSASSRASATARPSARCSATGSSAACTTATSGAEVDAFIFELRKAFPLRADQLSTTDSGPGVPIEAIEARNVVDGLRLVEHVPPPASAATRSGCPALRDADARPGRRHRRRGRPLLDLHDAVADLALAEGVHQAVQGNFDRARRRRSTRTRPARYPPEPEVVRTPRTGVTLTHRVGLHLDPADRCRPPGRRRARTPSPRSTPGWPRCCPASASVACRAVWKDPVTGDREDELVTLAELGLRPLDLLALVHAEDQAAMTELDDRVLQRVAAARSPRPDAVIEIRYMEHGPGQRSVFEVAPLVAHLRSLLARARPLRAGDVALPNEVAPDIEASARLDPARIEAVKSVADGLEPSLDAYLTTLDPLLADQPARRQDVLDGIDDFVDDAAALLARAAGIGLPQSGWGFALAWRRDQFGGLVKRLRERVARWDERLTAFGQILQRSSRCRAAAGRGPDPAAPAGGDRRVDDARSAAGERARPAHARRGQGRGLRGAPGRVRAARRHPGPAAVAAARRHRGAAAAVGVRQRAVRRQARRGRGRRVRDHPRRRRHRAARRPAAPDRDRPGAARRPRRRRRRAGAARGAAAAGRALLGEDCAARPRVHASRRPGRRARGGAGGVERAARASRERHRGRVPGRRLALRRRARARADATPGAGHGARGRRAGARARTAPARRRRALAGARLPAGPDDRQRAPALHGALRASVRPGRAAVRPAARRVDRGRPRHDGEHRASRSTTTGPTARRRRRCCWSRPPPGTAPGSGTTSSAR